MSRFPDNRNFAFTIFDDTDFSTVENTCLVYHFLSELGMKTTKSVWPLASVPESAIQGDSLQDPEYLKFILHLKRQGFEIGLHNARNSDSPRQATCSALETFHRFLGEYPRSHTNHAENRDNLYWGSERLSTAPFRLAFRVADFARRHPPSKGHIPGSQYFWGDVCRTYISYVRSFSFHEVSLERINPTLPYHDPRRPFVNFWFTSSEGGNVNSFCETISEREQDRLEEEGGVCIMYTHFSQGFISGRRLHPRFRELMTRLGRKSGWFVPVTTLLDHLQKLRSTHTLTRGERLRMERRWLLEKLLNGTT